MEPSTEDGYMSDDDIQAIQDLFDELGVEGPEPEFEGYAFYAENGDSIRFRHPDLESGDVPSGIPIEVVVAELTEAHLKIIADVARVGNLALTSVTGEDVRLFGVKPTSKQLEMWPDAATIEGTADLRHWLNTIIEPREVSG